MNGSEYETIQQAIDEAGTNKVTIVMITDAIESITIAESQDITID